MFRTLFDMLKDFNPVLEQRGDKFNLVSDIIVLSQVDLKGDAILFGYIENLNGEHGWIKVLDNEPSMKAIIMTVESQIALRTQA